MGFPTWPRQNGPVGSRALDRLATLRLMWPIGIVIAALAAAWLVYFDVAGPVRAVIALGFLLIGPGMAFVPLLRLQHTSYTVVSAVGLSLALDLIVAMAVLYSGFWSPVLILEILIALSLIGALCQVLLWHSTRRKRE